MNSDSVNKQVVARARRLIDAHQYVLDTTCERGPRQLPLGYVDEQGRLRLVGRATERFVRGGYNVHPVEVEAVLAAHPAVADVAVTPRADDVMGAIGVAVIVVRAGAAAPTLEDLRSFAAAHLARYKLPEALVVVDSLPLTPMEKLDRRALAALVQVSNEVINDSEPDVLDALGSSLARALALKLDLAVFEGAGSATEPRGLRNTAGIGTVSLGANGASPANLDVVADAIGTLQAGNADATALVMHPRTWQSLSILGLRRAGRSGCRCLARGRVRRG